jgi:hypothetical protein
MLSKNKTSRIKRDSEGSINGAVIITVNDHRKGGDVDDWYRILGFLFMVVISADHDSTLLPDDEGEGVYVLSWLP